MSPAIILKSYLSIIPFFYLSAASKYLPIASSAYLWKSYLSKIKGLKILNKSSKLNVYLSSI